MNNVERELRDLMDTYWTRLKRLGKEKEQAISYEEEETVKVLQRQCRIMIAELFQTMKSLGVLDEEEIEIGGIKNK